MRIRILHVIPSLGRGGAEMMASQLLSRIDKNRFVAELASLYDPFPDGLEPMLARAGVPVHHLGKHIGFDYRMVGALHRLVSAFRPEVVHTHLAALPYALGPALLGRVPKLIHTVHNMAEKEAQGLARLARRTAFQLGVLPVAISTEIARTVARWYPGARVTIVRNGVPVEAIRAATSTRESVRTRIGIGPDQVLFLSVGRLQPQKDPVTLLEAFAAGPAGNPRASLLVVGAGELRPDLEVRAHALGLDDRVEFAGMREDIPDLLRAADVFVLTSRWEGSPLAVMEAMAAGKPIVATAVGGVPELMEDSTHGFLRPPGDVAGLAQAMRKLADDAGLREGLARNAAAKALAEFDIRSMVEGYERLYAELPGSEARCPLIPLSGVPS